MGWEATKASRLIACGNTMESKSCHPQTRSQKAERQAKRERGRDQGRTNKTLRMCWRRGEEKTASTHTVEQVIQWQGGGGRSTKTDRIIAKKKKTLLLGDFGIERAHFDTRGCQTICELQLSKFQLRRQGDREPSGGFHPSRRRTACLHTAGTREGKAPPRIAGLRQTLTNAHAARPYSLIAEVLPTNNRSSGIQVKQQQQHQTPHLTRCPTRGRCGPPPRTPCTCGAPFDEGTRSGGDEHRSTIKYTNNKQTKYLRVSARRQTRKNDPPPQQFQSHTATSSHDMT